VERVRAEFQALVGRHEALPAEEFNGEKAYKELTAEAIDSKTWAKRKIDLFQVSSPAARSPAVPCLGLPRNEWIGFYLCNECRSREYLARPRFGLFFTQHFPVTP
jgi:hypothetical protein